MCNGVANACDLEMQCLRWQTLTCRCNAMFPNSDSHPSLAIRGKRSIGPLCIMSTHVSHVLSVMSVMFLNFQIFMKRVFEFLKVKFWRCGER